MMTFAAVTATGLSFQGWWVWAGDSWQWHPLQFEVRDIFGEVAGVTGTPFGLGEEVGGVDARVAVLGGEAGEQPADVGVVEDTVRPLTAARVQVERLTPRRPGAGDRHSPKVHGDDRPRLRQIHVWRATSARYGHETGGAP